MRMTLASFTTGTTARENRTMTQQEYETLCLDHYLDPMNPIQQSKRYRVTGWSSHHPTQPMTVWVDTVTDTMVKGHVTSKGYPLVDTSVWSRKLVNSWTWTEIDN